MALVGMYVDAYVGDGQTVVGTYELSVAIYFVVDVLDHGYVPLLPETIRSSKSLVIKGKFLSEFTDIPITLLKSVFVFGLPVLATVL